MRTTARSGTLTFTFSLTFYVDETAVNLNDSLTLIRCWPFYPDLYANPDARKIIDGLKLPLTMPDTM